MHSSLGANGGGMGQISCMFHALAIYIPSDGCGIKADHLEFQLSNLGFLNMEKLDCISVVLNNLERDMGA
jgi:hypothetical protein